MENKIHVALCPLVILSLSWTVEGQDLPVTSSFPSDWPLTLGIPGTAQAPLPGGSPFPPVSLSLPSTDYPKPANDLTDGGLSNNNNNSSSSNNIEVVVVDPPKGAPPPIQEENEVSAISVGVPAPPPIPEKTPAPRNLTEETVQPPVAPFDNQTDNFHTPLTSAPTHTHNTAVLIHKPPTTTPPHTPVHPTTPSSHSPHPPIHHPKTHSQSTTDSPAKPAPTRPETTTNTTSAPQPSSTPSPNSETSSPTQPKQPLSPHPTTTTTTPPPAEPTSEPQPQTSSTIQLLPVSTPASSLPAQTKTHANTPSQLNVVNAGEPVFHNGTPAVDPLLAGLVSAFIVTAAIITLLLFVKLRRRDQQPEFRRLQDLPMDDMMEDTPLSMYSL